jgi:PDZ domain
MKIGRETRQLLLILGVSAAALLALARLRFPDQPALPERSPAPLQRLAARATYEELATIVAEIELRLGPSLLAFRVAPAAGGDSGQAGEPGGPSVVPAVRVRPGLALALLDAGAELRGVVGSPALQVAVVTRDAVSGLAVIRLRDAGGGASAPQGIVRPASIGAPRYVLVTDATDGGSTLWPAFVGRADPVAVPGWDHPLLALGGTRGLRPGVFVFSLDGGFAGVALAWRGAPVLVPPGQVESLVNDLLRRSSSEPGDIGVEVQPLTPALAAATGTTAGVMVSFVDPDGPSATMLQPGDVVDMLEAREVTDADDFRARVARAGPGDVLTLSVSRNREQVGLVPRVTAAEAEPVPVLGTTLRTAPGLGARILEIVPGSVGARAGFAAGDTIVRFGGVVAPSARDVLGTFAGAPRGTVWLAALSGEAGHRVVAVQKP